MSYATLMPGAVFGRLTVLSATSKRNSHGDIIYLCSCACGNEKLTTSYLLKSGHVRSCGCLRKDKPNAFKHGMSESREFKIWADMHKRCTNPKHKSFSHYGARGIHVCKRWDSFENFFEDMGRSPVGWTIDRIDPNGNYEPANCRWASRTTQARNRRSNHLITYKDETHCLSEWAEKIGISREALKQRLKRGWPLNKALTGGAL